MTAQIIDLAERRAQREQERFDALLWTLKASLGMWEAYLAALAYHQRMVLGQTTIILQTEE